MSFAAGLLDGVASGMTRKAEKAERARELSVLEAMAARPASSMDMGSSFNRAEVRPPSGGDVAPMGDGWLRYSNQGKTRNDPLAPELVNAMSFLGNMGITMDVVSGGQEPAGTPGGSRTGSTRHDHGKAADVDFYMGDRKLDWNNAGDIPVLQEIVSRAKASGITGIGAGNDYMGPGRFHVGFGKPAVWGAGGKGENAPQWLVEAYGGNLGLAKPAAATTPAAPPAPPPAPALTPKGGEWFASFFEKGQ
jgi:hypothetical protein